MGCVGAARPNCLRRQRSGRLFSVDASHNWQYRVYITDGNSQITAAANMSFLAPRDFNGATVYPQKADVDMPNQPTKTTFAFFVIYQNAVCQNGEQAAGADPTAADPATHCVLKFPLVKDASWTNRRRQDSDARQRYHADDARCGDR